LGGHKPATWGLLKGTLNLGVWRGEEIRNLGTFGTNPKFGDLGTNHTLNLGTKPIKVLKLFWLVLNKAFSKILSQSF